MLRATLGACALVCAVLAAFASVADVQAEPQLTESIPPDGQLLEDPPGEFRLCFSEPVQLDTPDQFSFVVTTPDGGSPGSRTEFDPDGTCVTIEVGTTTGEPNGIWTLDWLVHAQSDGSEGSGSVRVQVGGDFGLTPAAPPDEAASPDAEDDSSSNLWLILAVVGGVLFGLIIAALAVRLVRRRPS